VPATEGILESSLYVRDLERALAFYCDLLGLRMMRRFEEEKGVALQAGPSSALLLFRADLTSSQTKIPAHGASGAGHVAFRVSPDSLAEWREHLLCRGVAIEREVSFAGKPPSIYFRDPDGNSLELAVASIWPF